MSIDGYDTYQLIKKSYGEEKACETIDDCLIKTPYDFIRFYENGKKNKENGATVVFTGKQFIFLKNGNNGKESHAFSFARTFLAMEGVVCPLSFNEAFNINYERNKKYLKLTIEAEDGINQPMYRWIRVYMNGPISQEEMASFQNFYDQFSDVIRKGIFCFCVRDDLLQKDLDIKDIDMLLEYLKCNVDPNKKPYISSKGEKIIGCQTENDDKVQSLV